MWWILGAVAIMGVAAGPIASDVEMAPYKVTTKHEAIELRAYDPVIVAETEVEGDRDEAIREGFNRIADYIFGNNISKQSIAMTAPVLQEPNESIAMTAPVLQEPASKGWRVQFVMPAKYTMDDLPSPKNHDVKLRSIERRHFAAITFSGIADEEELRQQTATLLAHLSAQRITPIGQPTFAFYNPPWTLPFLRRNEVLIPIQPLKE